ncbi:MAG TPA: MlaD family protein [Acetobacteraceae bacterium]|nr:MlaD family protein [Acetobacteraceae bacterium]
MIRLRHTDEWVGLMVIAAVLLFLGAMLEAGVLSAWFRPVAHLRIVLPQSGVGGLSAGADVQVLGIHAGTVGRVVLNPNGQIYAEADIDRQAEPFIRRDSTAVIRRTFGVAGAAYVDISRGTGAPMDWRYAVIDATTEVAPTDTLTAMLTRVQQKVFPVLDDAKRTMDALAALATGLQKGRGTIGELLTEDTLARETEQQIAGLAPVIAHLNDAATGIDQLAQRAASSPQGAPELLNRADALLANLQSASRDLARAAAALPAISRNLSAATTDLPALLTQSQATAADMQRLVTQLRSLWLLGGGGRAPAESRRLPASQIEP